MSEPFFKINPVTQYSPETPETIVFQDTVAIRLSEVQSVDLHEYQLGLQRAKLRFIFRHRDTPFVVIVDSVPDQQTAHQLLRDVAAKL